MDYDELSKMTVIQLREEAKKTDAKGVTGMKKDELIALLAGDQGIEVPAKKPAAAKKTSGAKGAKMDRPAVQKKLAELKAEQVTARAAGDKKQTALLRRRIHTLKRRSRKLNASR